MAAFLLCLVLAGVTSWLIGGTLLAPACCSVGPPPKQWTVESVTLKNKLGGKIAAWYVPAEGARATVVLLHPIRGNRRTMLGRATLLHDAGYTVVMIDMQAHGESPGEAITLGYLERYDAAAAVEFARAKDPRHRIGVIGWSLGGAAALLASPLDIDAMVLEAVYPTVDEAVVDRLARRVGPLSHLVAPLLIWQLGPRLGINASDLRPIDHVAKIACPVLVAAGEGDEHTTIAESRRMFEAAVEPKEFVVFRGAKHEDFLAFDKELYKSRVLAFFAKWINAVQ